MLPLDPAELPADAVEVGRITDAWGIKGWFRIQPYSASPEALFSSKRWYLQPPAPQAGLPKTAATAVFQGTVLLPINEAKDHSDAVVARSNAIADRTAAELLKGARIFVARSSFPSTGADEYYWVDLIGLEVHNREGVLLGTVHELLSTGPQTVLVVQQAAQGGGKPQECMIPFVAAYIDAVELERKRILVDWQLDY